MMEEPSEENTCRICLQKHETVYPFFGKQKGKSPSAGLRKLGVKVRIPGPKGICYECLTELKAALTFVEKCEKSVQTLAEQLDKAVPRKNNAIKNSKSLNFESKFSYACPDVIEVRTEGNCDENTKKVSLNKEKCLKPVPAHTCPICQKVFNRKFNFKLHLQRHSGDYDWACPTCGVRVISRWLAERHCQPRPRRPCPEPGCGKSYTSQYNLSTHIRTHKGERPFECSECGKKFTSKNTLGDHIRIHTGVKPYICPVCGKRFTTNKLSAHMWSHAGGAARPLGCPRGCARRFASRRALAHHVATHRARPARDHACRLCPATYSHKQSLNKHTRKRHSQADHILTTESVDTETKSGSKEIEKPTD